MPSTPAPKLSYPPESPFAWLIVGAVFISLAVIFGVSYSFAAFFESFAAEFAAQRADVSGIFGICGLCIFILGAAGGMLADRFGPRIVCSAGMLFIAGGLWWTSLASALPSIYLSYGLMVGLGTALVYTPAIASVQPWFRERRGLAAGIASAGIGAGTLLIPALIARLLLEQSWRVAMRETAIGVLLIGLCATAWLQRPVANPSQKTTARPGMALASALRSKPFVWLYVGMVFAAPAQFIPFAHVSAAARDLGIAAADAIGLVGIIGVGSLLGRFGVGSFADRIGRIPALFWMQVSMGLCFLLWASANSYPMLAGFALWFGLSYGAIVALLPAICMDLFGAQALSGIVGILYTGAAFGNLVGPVAAGAIFDQTQSYQIVLWICLLGSATAAFCTRKLQRVGRSLY
jgi:MFS family permease